MSWKQTVLYEQPVNELIRICLRLEQLFQQIHYYYQQTAMFDSKECLQSMLEAVNIVQRPELKTNLCKEFTRHYANLSKLSQIPKVDSSQLNAILDQLGTTIHMLSTNEGRLAKSLKDNEFLNAIRLQLNNPAGACNINMTSFNFWLHQSEQVRKQQLAFWLDELKPVKEMIALLLKLIRESTIAEYKTALEGFYELNLDAKQSIQLIRIELPVEQKLYPEISAGKHRICARFLIPNFSTRAQKTDDDVLFKLTCCVL